MIELLGGAGIVAALTLAIWALVAQRSAGNEKARADVLTERNKELTDKLAERAAALIDEKERGDALAAAVAKFAADAVGPVAGSYAELLQAVADARRRTGRASVVPDAGPPSAPSEATRGGDDGLLRPGE